MTDDRQPSCACFATVLLAIVLFLGVLAGLTIRGCVHDNKDNAEPTDAD